MKTRKQEEKREDAVMKNWKLSWIFVAVAAVVFAGPMIGTAATPTVDGLFFMSGDYANYDYLGADPGRGTLYYKLDGDTLYVAVVVSNTVNDNVFGIGGMSLTPVPAACCGQRDGRISTNTQGTGRAVWDGSGLP